MALCLCGLISFGQETEYRFPTKLPSTPEIQHLLDRVDPGQDDWHGEQDFLAIDRGLKKLAEKIWTGGYELEALADTLKRFSAVTLVEFKVLHTRRSSPQTREVQASVRFELGGESARGGLLSAVGRMEMVWQHSNADWILKSAKTSHIEESSSSAFFFKDVTRQALAHNPSFEKQLNKAIDHWRSVLDAATGISVYGHQGLAVGDYNGDGWEDLYICQPSGLPNLLYRNNGDGAFTDVTAGSGLDILDDTSMALFADVDNDGDDDLIAILPDRALLFRNDSHGKFKVDPTAGLAPPAGKTSILTGAALADYDNDGDLDLYICSYEFWQGGASYGAPTPYFDATNGPPNFFFRNRGDGVFEEITDRTGLSQNNDRFSFAAAFGDYDRDGDQDLYVANDFGRNNLYRNNGDGTFTDVAGGLGVEDMAAGMSAAWGDYDNDGDLDLYVGNMWSSAGQRLTFDDQFRQVAASPDLQESFRRHARGNSLFRNEKGARFTDVTLDAAAEMGRWAWSSDFLDLNNDGWLDLYIANGYITGPQKDDL